MRLEIRDLDKRYDGQPVLRGVSLEVKSFRCLVLVGPSGGGKSTLLRVLAGLERPDGGGIRFDGEPLSFSEEALLRHRRSVGTVFQSYNLFPHLTALDNITLPLVHVHGLTPAEAAERGREWLRRFRMEEHGEKRPAQLSGGQRQRVAIVRAVAVQPRFLLFDEPTSALDPEMTAEVLDMIRELKGMGIDLLLVTHQVAFARSVADYAAFLAAGRILEAGPAPRLFDHPQERDCRRFLETVLRY